MKKSFLCLVTSLAIMLASAGTDGQIVPRLRPVTPLVDGADTVSVVIIGDVMMHAGQLPYDYSTFLERISGSLREADIAVANMEFSLGGKPYTGYPCFSAPDSYAWTVAQQCGVDLFLTANNHILDRGTAGLKRTLDVYDKVRDSLGVLFTGTSRSSAEQEANSPAVISRRGIRIAFVNFTYGTNSGTGGTGWPRVNMLEGAVVDSAFSRAKAQGADFIVAIPHWGNEYQFHHSSAQQRWAERMVKDGADVIVGGHPHIVQDTTHISGVPVIYSVGNAVSNMTVPKTRMELMVTLRFVRNNGTGEKTMLEPELDFMWCTLPGTLSDSYRTIFVNDYIGTRGNWHNPGDYDMMLHILDQVKSSTGIGGGA
ncbi:MAG: CapA family protein [Bacteroidales bacterium]|nr:CapA family protein [Bacteroidales bacterium]